MLLHLGLMSNVCLTLFKMKQIVGTLNSLTFTNLASD